MRARPSTSPAAADRPTLLLVGQGDPMEAALKIALDRHGMFVEVLGDEDLKRTVQVAAPDVILLVGDAADEAGAGSLELLASDRATAGIPVVLLAPDTALENRLRAFRHGAMAVVPRTASADFVARRVAEMT
ncbi:MAG: hypothetical protein K8H88_30430, partial [Sandaracinaceae bacterium]|nr:hypothetical protein [Sandaracinaceae bacterium]